MIATSRFVALCSVVGALGFHVVSVMAIDMDEDVLMEAAAGAGTAALGDGFQDLAVGTIKAAPVEDASETPTPGEAPTRQPVTEADQPMPDVLKPAERPDPADPNRSPVTYAPVVETVKALKPQSHAEKLASKVEPVQMAAVTPTHAANLVATPPRETISAQAQAPESGAARLSRRPQLLPRDIVQTQAKPKPTSAPQPKTARREEAKPAKRGNAQRQERKGSASGNHTAKAATQGLNKGTGTKSGNARASNYPGLVMRRIQRVRRPSVGSRGTAVIAFKIAANGGLSAVSIARSSGSSQLDQAAVRVVRKAAPFPKPPAGAQRNFSIRIKGR